MSPSRRVTARTLAEAEKLAVLRFTPAERRQAAASYGSYRAGIREARDANLDNGEAPAGGFDPRLPGMAFEMEQRPLVRSKRVPRLPSADIDIAFAPVSTLSRWIESGKLSSERLTRIYLDRLKRHDAKLHCVITLIERQALAAARRADAEIAEGHYRGPLHGIPWGAKDLLDTRGVRTTWGAMPYKDRVAKRDATVVERLAEAGAVLIAKLSLGALASGDVWFEAKTRSPWDRRQGASGSSAGSGAAVAAGLVGFAIGTETLGSIVSPSMRNGAAGLRPTFGRVPRSGAMALSWTMDKIGPMTRGVEDTALVLDAIRGADGEDLSATDLPFNFDASERVRGLRVGHIARDFRGRGSAASDRQALDELRAVGAQVEPLRLPKLPGRALLSPILFVEVAAAFDDLTRSDRDDLMVRQSPDAWPNMLRTARMVPAVEYVQATRLRTRLMRDLDAAFDGFDAIITPGRWSPLVALTNYTGHPTLTLRAAVTNGRPRSVTLVGPLYEEGTLIRLGMALERRLDVRDLRPPID
ncbi:MAG TPA: amidase [Dehalococcoidia bacterium]|nr:amidase [Dehalococcoidia bacterium]